MIDHYLQAFATVLLPQNLLAMVLGSLWGLLAGALPGISTSMGVVLLLSFTYSLSPMTAFVLLIGAYLGGITAGSITSILFGIPGEPSSVPTVIEGHPIAKQGRPAYALWVYLLCSIFGGTFSVVFMIVPTVRLPPIEAHYDGKRFQLSLAPDWLGESPLTVEALKVEIKEWKKLGIALDIVALEQSDSDTELAA